MSDKHVSKFQAEMDAAKADAILRFTGGGTIKSESEMNAESNIISSSIPTAMRVKKEEAADAAISLVDLPAADDSEPEQSKPRVTTTNPYAGLKASRKRKHPDQQPLSTTQDENDLLLSEDHEDEQDIPVRRIKRKNVSMGVDGAGPSSFQQPAAQSQPRPFAPAKRSQHKAATPLTTQLVATRTTTNTGSWYDTVDMRASFSRSDLETLKFVLILIQNCETGARIEENLEPLFAKLRKRIHEMETYDFVSGVLLRKSKVLEDKGLDSIIEDRTVGYPWDIVSDALGLYRKWRNGILDPHLLRGVEIKKGKNAKGNNFTSRSFEAGYPGKKSCNYTGEGSLVNGQWWPLQICAMRDGAHGELEGGIHGQPGQWAYSIVLGGSGYSDVDEGNMIKYCGTSGAYGEASAGTKMLKKAHEEAKDVRVLRSASLAKDNPYRPSKGLRYDGVYKVTDYEILDAGSAMHRFTLRRRSYQDPIRCAGVAARPTDEELSEYTKIRGLIGLST